MPDLSTNSIKCQAAISLDPDPMDASREVCAGMAETSADLAVVFLAAQHQESVERVVETIRRQLDVRNLVGCMAEGVIGPGVEVEGRAALALWTAVLPGVRVMPILLDQDDLGSLNEPAEWRDRLGVAENDRPSFMILPDPFSIEADRCVSGIESAFPGSIIMGGMASGGRGRGQNRLFLNDQVLRQGLVGISISEAGRVDTVVSQGCRPVGKTWVITKAHKNVIEELGGQTAIDALRQTMLNVTPKERVLMENGLHIGRVVDEHLRQFGVGDFLIRNILAVVGGKAIAVSDWIRPGQTVQFHVRDAATATEELRTLLDRRRERSRSTPAGGLLFCCNGRGKRLFGKPSHDVELVNQSTGHCPVAGFFAQGEIGPVGHRTFLHGFTSCLMLFQNP